MFGAAEQDSEEYQLYEQAGGTFKELQERFNKMLYDASNVSKKSGTPTEYQSGEVINEDGDLRFKLSNENADLLDRYTEKTYNNYGWIAVNDVLTKSEWSQYNRKLRETLTGKTPKNFYGESVMTVGEHSSDISALVYVKGTASNPIVTKVVRFDTENQAIIDILKEEVLNYERSGYRTALETVESDYTEKIFNIIKRSDFADLQELRKQTKRSAGQAIDSDSGIEQNRRGSAGADSADSEAGVDDTSAFSNGEKELRFSFGGENAKTADKLKLSTAMQMEKDGVDSETIRKETGWFKGYDNKWRFEIDDSKSRLVENPPLELHGDNTDGFYRTGKLSDLYVNTDLYAAYPELKDITVIIQQTENGVSGTAFSRNGENQIVLSQELFKRYTKEYSDYLNGGRLAEIKRIEQTPEYKEYQKYYDEDKYSELDPEVWLEKEKAARDKFFGSEIGKRYYQLQWGKPNMQKYELGWSKNAKEVLLHELQHIVQSIEGMTMGSSPEFWSRKLLEAENNYKTANRTLDRQIDNLFDVLERYGVGEKYNDDFDIFTGEGVPELRNYLKSIDAPRGVFDMLDNIKWYIDDSAKARTEYMKIKNRSSGELYSSTAGEIEARDSANRSSLTAEQRKNTRPDIDRTDVVFADGGVYSANAYADKFGQQIDDWLQGKMPKDGYFDLGITSPALVESGADKLSLVMPESVIYKFTTDYNEHAISLDDIRRLPYELQDPVFTFKGSVKNSIVALSEITDKSGNEVIAAIHLSKRQGRYIVNRIASVYGKNNIKNYVLSQIEKGNLINPSRKKALNWFTTKGLQLPEVVQTKLNAYSDINISQNDTDVNSIISKKSQNDTSNFRYSISGEDKIAKQESKNLEKENEALKNRLHESEIENDRLRRETQLTEFTTKDDPSVNSFAKSLRRKYGSTMTTAELHQRLNDIYYHLAKRGGKASNVISDKCLKLAEDIANTATQKRQGEFWNELRGYFKDKRITLSEQDRNDMGDWQSFRKKYQQSFGLRNEGGLPVDVVYMELHEQFPGLFDDTVTHPADQLREIGEVYEKLILITVYIKRKRPVTNRSSSRAFPIHSDTQKTE